MRHPSTPQNFTRREFAALLSMAAAGTSFAQDSEPATRQASGVKVGEVTSSSAIVWVRLTLHAAQNESGTAYDADMERSKVVAPEGEDPATFRWAAPGAPGRVRVRFSPSPELAGARATEWVEVGPETGCIHQFKLSDLRPGTRYYYESETASLTGELHAPARGQFHTAPAGDDPAPVTFALLNCQLFAHRQSADGFDMYPAIKALAPHFIGFTGDQVYYDRDAPLARSRELARFHWQRMYGLPRHVELLRNTGSYWVKDDHDTLVNDCWPGRKTTLLAPFTFEEGQQIFREQVPMGDEIYRSFRWGADLQIWLIEGRDFRSPNNAPDGPGKSILGAAQKRWLQETLAASNATWKVLISPTPWVGPDRGGKSDNHANANFRHEQTEMLSWFREHLGERLVILCGDRHWQYHSVHPEFGTREFSVGPCADAHAQHPKRDPAYHQFFRDRGGFLSAGVARGGGDCRLTVRLHDVTGTVVHEWAGNAAV